MLIEKLPAMQLEQAPVTWTTAKSLTTGAQHVRLRGCVLGVVRTQHHKELFHRSFSSPPTPPDFCFNSGALAETLRWSSIVGCISQMFVLKEDVSVLTERTERGCAYNNATATIFSS